MFKAFKADPPKNGQFYTVAIDGRAGAGKTAFAKDLSKLLPDFIFFNGDDYFEPSNDKLVWGSFNDGRFIKEVIKPLQTGNKIVYRPYDWEANPPISERAITIEKGLCLERCYSFRFELDWDLKIWIEAPRELCLKRGVAREHLPKETVIKTWSEVWQPLEDDYIEKYDPQFKADVIIDGTIPFPPQLNQL